VAVGEAPLHVKSLVDKVAVGGLFSEYFEFPWQYHSTNAPIFILIQLLSEGQAGEALFGISGNISRKSAFNCLLQTFPSDASYFNQSQFLSCNVHLTK
jgi:hypothetical protein